MQENKTDNPTIKRPTMEIAIVILNWNGAEMMRKYLPNVVKHSVNATVFVADNASTDDSLSLLANEFPTVRTIVLEKNWGFADGYNKALEQIDAEYYLLLNSDVRVEDGWLDAMLDYMRKNNDVAACQPKLLSDLSPTLFEYAGACGGFIDRYGYPYCRGRILEELEEDHGQYNTVMELLWASGACLLIRSTDYWKAGGLDGRFFAHNEEIDLCWRLNIMGRRVVCIPQSKVYHLGGGTLPKGNPQKTYLNFRNNLTMLYKNLPDNQLQRVMLVRWCLDYLAAFQTLILKRDIGGFKAIFRARHDFKKWKKDFANDRKKIQGCRQTTNDVGRSAFSLLWQYYIKGIRKYSLLPKY